MENATEILVVILSAFLAIFLALGIALLIGLLKLTKILRNVAEHAENVATNVDAAAALFKNAAGPLAAGKFLMNIAEAVKSKKKGRE